MWSEADIWRWFSAAGDGCYVVNDRGEIVLWNGAVQKLLGLNPEEALQRLCYEVIRGRNEDGHPLCQPKCAIWEAAFKKGTSIPGCYLSAHRKEGESLWLNVSLLLIPSPPAKTKYIVHLLRDASQEKRALDIAKRVSSLIEKHTKSVPGLWDPPSPDPRSFSKRELEILELLAGWNDTKAIAWYLSISPHTVRNHLQSISGKLGLHSRLDLLIYAFKNHLGIAQK